MEPDPHPGRKNMEGTMEKDQAVIGQYLAAGVPHTVHQAHVVSVRDGRIARDEVWCGGRWPAPLMEEMAAAADG